MLIRIKEIHNFIQKKGIFDDIRPNMAYYENLNK